MIELLIGLLCGLLLGALCPWLILKPRIVKQANAKYEKEFREWAKLDDTLDLYKLELDMIRDIAKVLVLALKSNLSSKESQQNTFTALLCLESSIKQSEKSYPPIDPQTFADDINLIYRHYERDRLSK